MILTQKLTDPCIRIDKMILTQKFLLFVIIDPKILSGAQFGIFTVTNIYLGQIMFYSVY